MKKVKKEISLPTRNSMKNPVAVIGAGSWGTALTRPLAVNAGEVRLWAHRPEHVEALSRDRENRSYLPGYRFPENVRPLADLAEAVRGCRAVVMVVPSHVFRAVFAGLVPHLEAGSHIVSAAKGIENETLRTMTEVMAEELPKDTGCRTAVLSGPSFAREVADELPSAVTVAAGSEEEARFWQHLFSTDRFRVYGSTDVVGLQLGGALKNIVAIAAGICDGLKYGTNARAALITRGLAEISRLGIRMGANPLTFAGLGGLGDLVLTCTGDLSRNRSVGLELGRGKKLNKILAEMNMVAEGVKTTRSAMALARKVGVEMPILEQVYRVLYEDVDCGEAVSELMGRDLKQELS